MNSRGPKRNRRATGAATSDPFPLHHDRIMFLVRSKPSPSDLYVSLEVEGKEILRETGEDLKRFSTPLYDVSAYRGKQAVLKVVDNNRDRNGVIHVDAFCSSFIHVGAKSAK